jgi:two-component system sensor histidine kinase DegS
LNSERHVLARELHDQVLQMIFAMRVEMERFRPSQYGRQSVLDEVDFLKGLTDQVLQNLRNLVADLRHEPALRHGLVAGIREHLIPHFTRLMPAEIEVRIADSWPHKLDPVAAFHLYRILQEALNNVWRHAGASTAEILLDVSAGYAIVTIRDNGLGAIRAGMSRDQSSGGLGILGMRERATILGGGLDVLTDSDGTVVRVVVPVAHLLP